jgi:shikimate kinase
MNIALTGPRASGKTTIGQALARRRGMRFVDLDEMVKAQFEEDTVREIWARHGETAWRAAELSSLRSVVGMDGQVIALGGGAPMIDAARNVLTEADRMVIIYLKCSVGELERRLKAVTGDRPSLTGADPADEVATVLAVREPVYEALAHTVVEMDGLTEEQALERVDRVADARGA